MSIARRPGRTLAILASTLVAGLGIIAPAAHASTDSYVDDRSESGVYDQRGDIAFIGADYDEGFVTVALGVGATEPLGSSTWTAEFGNRFTIGIDLDGTAYSTPEFEVAYWPSATYTYGPDVVVRRVNAGDILCKPIVQVDPDAYYIGFPASCIGSPAAFQIKAFLSFDNGFTSSMDWAPSSTYCCAVIEGPLPEPQPQPDPPVTTAGGKSGYWMITDNGEVSAFGDAKHFGNEIATTVKRVDIDPTPSGNGYWILAESGAVHAKGDARWLGSALTTLASGEKAAALSSTANGDGYWIFTDRGRVLAYGTAKHFGDMSGVPLNGPVLDAVATPAGDGYWMVASDGGVFNFGNAKFSGSTGNLKLNKPVMSMAPDPDGSGYWLVASDGGIFAFEAQFYGSMGGTPLNKPVSGIVPGSGGYMMVGEDGGIFSFGNVKFHGSLGANPPVRPVVAVALMR